MVACGPISKFSKRYVKIFTLWAIFTFTRQGSLQLQLVLKIRKLCLFTACLACIGILPHAQHEKEILYSMLSMHRTFFSAHSACLEHFSAHNPQSACIKCFDSFQKLAEHSKTHFYSAYSTCAYNFFSACSACLEHFLAHTQHAKTLFSAHSAWGKMGNISFILKNKQTKKFHSLSHLPRYDLLT